MLKSTVACIAWLLMVAPAAAEPTQIVVRVISQDGKFVGDHTGGASITLREVKSGRVLARGVTRGGTGDTERIMEASRRSPSIALADAASYKVTLDLSEPTLVDLEVEGPIGRPRSSISVRSQRWIVPGVPVTAGNGWLVELPGLAITPTISMQGRSVLITAKVELMCGCPITPDGPWPSADYAVTASIWSGRHELASGPLAFTAAPGTFSGRIALPRAGKAKIYVNAVNGRTGNSGLATVRLP